MSPRALSNRLTCKTRERLHIAGLWGTPRSDAASVGALRSTFFLARQEWRQAPANCALRCLVYKFGCAAVAAFPNGSGAVERRVRSLIDARHPCAQ